MIELALYQPDIPQNTGTLLRLSACWGFTLHLIEPLGFIFNEQKMRRAGMDYIDDALYQRHVDMDAFVDYCSKNQRRLVLATTKASQPLQDFQFLPQDIIMMGRESAGVPDDMYQFFAQRIRIPMQGNARSLNMAISASVMLFEAFRQTDQFGQAGFK